MLNEAIPALDEVVGHVAHLRDRIRSGEVADRSGAMTSLDEVMERLYAIIEELQTSNEELRRAVLDLQFERERYSDLFHHGAEGCLLTDAAGTITDANRAAGVLLGGDPQRLAGCRLADLVVRGHVGDAAQHMRRARGGESGTVVLVLLRSDGDTRKVEARYLPLPAREDTMPGSQWLLADLERPLFEAEDRDVDDPALARRWLTVYGELAAATEALVRDAAGRAELLDQPARRTFEEQQIRPLESRLVRVREGHRHWRRRHAALIDLDFDLGEPDVRYHERAVQMSLRERQVLHALLSHPGQTFSAAALLVQAWHSSYLAEEQMRTYVVRIRRKLRELGAPCRLLNRRGRGYALVFEERRPDA
jgi:PAS domain S-box-containing protein